ncbi:hypothetical protein WJX82_003514 [Trebouxia sp. C0006]
MMRLAGSSKSRKPYKITKPRQRWSEEEHEKFLEAIDRFGRNWKDIVSFVGTRSVSQVRSHAQKHFIRLEKKGLGSVVPPARRKARWGDKQAPDSLDSSIDSDQELSAANRQAGSSSSMSTVDFYHTRTTAGSSAQCTEGSGSNAEYHDCQPITSRQESFASFPSQGSSLCSPPSQSIISYAQEFLRRCNSSGVKAPAAAELTSCTPPQSVPATARGTNVDVLQEVSDQQLCPQLDGTFLADVIKASSAPPSLPLHSLSQPIIATRSFSASSTRTPLGSAFHMGLKGNQEPSPNVSPTTSFQTLPSNSSILTVKPDLELPVGLCAADIHLDSSFGLDEQDFWDDFSLEDPLMQAVDAAMECGASDDSCL